MDHAEWYFHLFKTFSNFDASKMLKIKNMRTIFKSSIQTFENVESR